MAGLCSNFYRHAARGGGGAVFGSKNLKAIAVRGTKRGVSCYDNAGILNLQKRHDIQLNENPIGKKRKRFGSPLTLQVTNNLGMLPTSNFRSGIYPKAAGMLDPESLERSTITKKSCMGCIEACSKITHVSEGKFKGLTLEGPEYETIALFGSNLDIDYLPAIIKSNELCDDYGMDTISAAVSIGFLMECYEKKLIGLEDTGGMPLEFGDYDRVHELLHLMGQNSGFGKVVNRGVRHLAEVIGQGSESFAMHVKGLEIPAYDPRASVGAALVYAVTPRGGCHRRCWPPANEIAGESRFDAEGKAALVKKVWDHNTVYHSVMICDYLPKHMQMSDEDMGEYIHAVSGLSFGADEFAQLANENETIIREFNCNEGFTREHDNLPHRFLNEALLDGPAAGKVIGEDNFNLMLDDYYKLRGWNPSGEPAGVTGGNSGKDEAVR
jgi:aldehyde:ferredoxin oxidoreductase